jgi:toxin ParE1/3/4
MLEILLSDQAKADLIDIWLYIAEDNIPAADRLNQKISESLDRLSEFPGIGRERPEISVVSGLRSLPVGQYIIFYQVTDNAIRVHRVLQGNVDIPNKIDDHQ